MRHREHVLMKPLSSTGVEQFLSIPDASHKILTADKIVWKSANKPRKIWI